VQEPEATEDDINLKDMKTIIDTKGGASISTPVSTAPSEKSGGVEISQHTTGDAYFD